MTIEDAVRRNQLLAGLPVNSGADLCPQLEPVSLTPGQLLGCAGDEISHGYFLTQGLISVRAIVASGESVELMTVGREGFVGLPLVMETAVQTNDAVVMCAGSALRVRAETLRRAMREDAGLSRALLAYAHSSAQEVGQQVACQRFHSVLERLCRWLLTASERAELETLHVTHDTLARVLGAARPVITKAGLELQDAGAIRSRYGRLSILNRGMLERSACECYQGASRHSGRALDALATVRERTARETLTAIKSPSEPSVR